MSSGSSGSSGSGNGGARTGPAIIQEARAALEREAEENKVRKNDYIKSRYAMRDLLLIDEQVAAGMDYLVKHPTDTADSIEKGMVKYFQQIQSIKSTLVPRIFLGYLIVELPLLTTGWVASKVIEDTDAVKLRKISQTAQTFYDKTRTSTYTLADFYAECVKAIRAISEINPAMKDFIGQVLNDPMMYDIRNAYISATQTQAVDTLTSNDWAVASSVFVSSVLISFVVALFFIGGGLAANDAIWRPAAYRILYFLWGGAFFLFTIPYYLVYREFMSDLPVQFFAHAIPLIAVPVGMTNAPAEATAEPPTETTIWDVILFPFKLLFGWVGVIWRFLVVYEETPAYFDFVARAREMWESKQAAVATAV